MVNFSGQNFSFDLIITITNLASNAEELFRNVKKAYDVLSDADEKRRYDKKLAADKKGPSWPPVIGQCRVGVNCTQACLICFFRNSKSRPNPNHAASGGTPMQRSKVSRKLSPSEKLKKAGIEFI